MLSLHPCPSARYREVGLTGARPCMRELMLAAAEPEQCQRPPRQTGLAAWQPYATSITEALASVGRTADSAWQLGTDLGRDTPHGRRRRILSKTRFETDLMSDSDHEGVGSDIDM